MESFSQMVEAFDGFGALEFQHMAHEFIRKPDGAVFHVRELLALFIFSKRYIGAGEHIQGVAIHDHVLHLDAVTLPKFVISH